LSEQASDHDNDEQAKNIPFPAPNFARLSGGIFDKTGGQRLVVVMVVVIQVPVSDGSK